MDTAQMNGRIDINGENSDRFDDLYVLPVGEYFIIFSPLRGITALSDKVTIQYLYDILFRNDTDDDKRKTLGHLLENIHGKPPQYPQYPEEVPDPFFLGLIPTRACNGACIYCGFEPEDRKLKKMDYQTAVTAIDWMAARMKELKKDTLEIHFFGGEPLFAPDVVSVAVHYARMTAARKGLIPVFEVSTNGLVPDQTTRFVSEYFTTAILSIDGPEEIHNRLRPMRNKGNSFATAVRFAEKVSLSNCRLCLRTCVSAANLDLLPRITEWFCQTFRPSMIDFENLKSNEKPDELRPLEPDPFLFARQYARSLTVATRYGVELVNGSIIADQPQFSSCPVGKDTIIVDPDGKISSCYLFPRRWKEKGLDLSAGQITNGEMRISTSRLLKLREMVKDKPRCPDCYCRWTCAGGCHVDVTWPGSGADYDNYCRQTRIMGIIKILSRLEQHNLLARFLDDDRQLIDFSMRKRDKLKDWPGYE